MSGSDDNDLIQIRATSKRNGVTSVIIGLVGLLVAVLLLTLLPKSAYLVGIFAASASIVSLLIGWFKIREPDYSIEISRDTIFYRHRHGQWQVDWNNVHRIDTPKIHSGIEHKALGMVGIRLKDYQPLLDSISPRLATNLLLEQRPLLLQGDNNCNTGACYSATLIEDDVHKLPDGKVIKGIKAMLANRMEKLRNNLGFDLFISAAEIDRDTEQFVTLLKQCQARVLSSTES